MIGIKGKTGISLPVRVVVWHVLVVAGAVLFAMIGGWAVGVFPFEPERSFLRLAAAMVGVGLFIAGMLTLMLGGRFYRRIAGVHAMAAAAAVLLVALSGSGVAWVIALAGWVVAGAMSGWGIFLVRGNFRNVGKGRER